MVTREIRILIESLVKATKEANVSIQEIVNLVQVYYSQDDFTVFETKSSLTFRKKAEKVVSEMKIPSNTMKYWDAVEILCSAYENKSNTYKRDELAKELAKRKQIPEIKAYSLINDIIYEFARYLVKKSLHSHYGSFCSSMDTDSVLRLLVSYIENAFNSK